MQKNFNAPGAHIKTTLIKYQTFPIKIYLDLLHMFIINLYLLFGKILLKLFIGM